eukprot:CAMPEP_0172003438 /NCGR_PEP_ID=MMETSP1041-20130122/3939_1 /TAXON_ID=464988 /ORGANISM="Hemiselmis andersenii, Strain CCMP439" /LENGTH=143 /DNA_ID=CAMNT_0012657217 /DNA_START=28 /DNA_END=459 /DNA_ORIENTATION=-
MTSGANLMRMVVRVSAPTGTVWAVTRAGKSAESRMPCTTPATKAAQFKCPMSFGTLMYVFTSGSFSWIIYSSSFSVTFSKASAGLPHITFHTVSLMKLSIPTTRVSRFDPFSRSTTSSSILTPTPYPAPASFFSRSWMDETLC